MAIDAATPRALIGERTPDLMLEPPSGFSPSMDGIFEIEGHKLGYTLGSVGDRGVITLDERRGEGKNAYFEILDVVVLDEKLHPDRLSNDCNRGGQTTKGVVAVLATAVGQPVQSAWAVDVERRKLRAIDTGAVTCRSQRSPRGVPGGVSGGVIQ